MTLQEHEYRHRCDMYQSSLADAKRDDEIRSRERMIRQRRERMERVFERCQPILIGGLAQEIEALRQKSSLTF